MTGQGTLFKLGAELLEQPSLFDGAAAGEEPAAAAAAADPARIPNQRGTVLAREREARDHRRYCLRCVDGRQCRDGRKLETEARLSRDVLRAMLAGEL